MVRGRVAMVALMLGASTLAGCAAVVAGGGDASAPGWTEEMGQGLRLSFAEPADLAHGTADSDLIREPASSADLLVRPDFDPMIDAHPLGQDATEAAGAAGDEGRETATDVFDDSLMTDDGVLPPKGGEEPAPRDEDEAAGRS